MDCSRFRRQHLAYLDDTLPGDQMAAAQCHLLQCAACAAHDTRIRRSLMVARSLPPISPSATFRGRLDARLAECRSERLTGGLTTQVGPLVVVRPVDERPLPSGRVMPRPLSRPLAAMAASAVLGALAWQLFRSARPPALAMQPVIAARTPSMASPPQPMMPLPAAFAPSAGFPMAELFPPAGVVPVRSLQASY